MIKVPAVGENLEQQEIEAYIAYVQKKLGGRTLKTLDIVADGEEVELHYTYAYRPVERIRRITGYLVGTMERWDDAKAAEERDRVKHSIG